MASLGTFGTEHEEITDTFGWFGADIRVHPDLTDLVFIDLFAAMSDPEDGAAAVEALRGIAASLVHPDDLDRFWTLARANRQKMEDIAGLATGLIGALTERPTKLPSDSSDGQPATVTTSTGDFSSQAIAHWESRGRADLAVAVMRAN